MASFLGNTSPETAFKEKPQQARQKGRPRDKDEVKSVRLSFAMTPNDYNKFRVVVAQISNRTGKKCTPNSVFNEWLTSFLEEHKDDLVGFKEIPHDAAGNAIEE